MCKKKETAFPSSKAGTLGKAAHQSQQHNNSSPAKHQDQTPNLLGLTRQALILFGWLKREKEIDTLTARRRGVNHPAGRVKDLRNRGVKIETFWTDGVSQTGKVVRIALYVLQYNPQLSLFDLRKNSVRREN